MTGDLWTAGRAAPPSLSALTEDERYRHFDRLQARMAGVWDVDAAQPRRRVGRRRTVDLAGPA